MPQKYFIFVFFLFLLFPSQIFANINININDHPSEIKIGEEKTLNFSGILELNQDYYFKIYLGKESLTKGLTYNPESNEWLTYSGSNGAWELMPIFNTNSEGTISGQLKFKISDSGELGENQLELGYRKVGDDKTLKSNTVTIEVKEADPTPTPTATQTPTPEPTATPKPDYDNIYITEIYPSPESGNEWIEIYNDNDSDVNLDDWYIKDSADNKKSFDDFEITAKSYVYFAFGSGYLNNSGDTVKLYNSEDEEKFSLPETYPEIEEDLSWAKVGDSWCIASPTKGNQNASCYQEDVEEEESEDSPTPTPTFDDNEESETDKILNRKMPQTATDSATSEPEVKGISDENKIETKKKSQIPPIALILSGVGLVLILGAATPFIYPKIKPLLLKLKKKKKNE